MSQKVLALFDFDGTLTHRDSLLDFIVYVFGWPRVLLGGFILLPVLLGYMFGVIKNDDAKRKVIQFFLAGKNYQDMKDKGDAYGRDRLPKILRKEALDKFRWHKQQGHRVFIVTASSEIWLGAWAASEQLELIGTRYQVVDGLLTGCYQGLNCHGQEKVKRIQDAINLEYYDDVYAYGDTSGDLPMLSLANHSFFKPFR